MRVNRLFVLFVALVLVVSWYSAISADAASSVSGVRVSRANPKRSRTLTPVTGGVKPTTQVKGNASSKSASASSSAVTSSSSGSKSVPVAKLSPAQFQQRLKSKRSDPLFLFNKRSAPSAANLQTALKKRHGRVRAPPASKFLGVFANDVSGKSQTVQAKSAAKAAKAPKAPKAPKAATAKKVRFSSLRDPTGAGGNGGQSGKTGGQSGKTGGQSGKTGGQSGKTGGQSGKTGGTSGGDVLTAPPVAPASSANVPVNGLDPKEILVLNNIEGRTDPNDPVVVFFRNQGDGAGCWAIAAVTIFEIYLQMKGGSFAKQNIQAPIAVDQVIKCVPNDGPNGGNPVTALTWLFHHPTIMERDYRRGTPLTCPPSGPSKGDFGVWDNPCTKGDCSGQGKNEMAMAQSMFAKDGNVQTMFFVYVDASQWQNYQKPDWPSNLADPANLADYVFPTAQCSYDPTKGNHIVVIETVVEDPKTQKMYWKLLNSWGTSWGAAGFIYLEFGVNACGLANYVSVVSSEPPPAKRLL